MKLKTIKLQRPVIGLIIMTWSMMAISEEAYTLNPGDILSISVWSEDALQQEVMVLPDGTISFPLVGILKISSKTPAQVQDQIKQKLSRVIPDPEVNVTVTSVSGNNIFIIGKVNNPGQMTMIRPTDVMQALSLAGGLTAYAKSNSIRIIRRTDKGQEVINFDYTKITEGKAPETNVLLKSGDTIIVP
ncbi:MAG: polysaccharide export protein [Gammaproteobacteria bacterium]|nr:polysaccharide export protein [Gammaproteobacteria bacterium]